MTQNCTALYNVEAIRKFENIAIEKYKIKVGSLMQRAGEGAFKILRANFPHAKKIAIVCGKGNNGGDGYVLAQLVHKARLKVTVFYMTAPKNLKDIAKKAALNCKKKHIKLEAFSPNKIKDFDLIVDALFGIGLKENIKGDYALAIDAINKSAAPVLAIDVPSGLDADNGLVLGKVVRADVTATFIGLKLGLFLGGAKEFCGKIICDDLQLPIAIFHNVEPNAQLTDLKNLLKETFPNKRKRTAHKGDFGHVLVIGGDYGMGGAVHMAAEAAARAGAGLVSVATRKEHIAAINRIRPEIMCHNIDNHATLSKLIKQATIIAIGPGLGQSAWSKKIFSKILNTAIKKTLIIDADALNLLAQKKFKSNFWILTPHPGEAGRLLNVSTVDIQNDRLNAIQKLQKKYGGLIVLKGANTLIYDGQNIPSICQAGNPGMATGGMGDILTGLIAGLAAQKIALNKAAELGVSLHAEAGDLATKEYGERGLLATDLLLYVRKLLNKC